MKFIFKNLDLDIGSEIWFMEDNKAVCYYVQEVLTQKKLTFKSDYGQPYDHQIIESNDYRIFAIKNNDSKSVYLSDIHPHWYNTKEELLKSL